MTHILTSFSSHCARRSLRRRSIRICRRASDASLLNFSRNIPRMTFHARFCSRNPSTKASSSSGGDEDRYGLVAVLALVAGAPQDEAVSGLGFRDPRVRLSSCFCELVLLEVDVETE
jgi:hypothetical protein